MSPPEARRYREHSDRLTRLETEVDVLKGTHGETQRLDATITSLREAIHSLEVTIKTELATTTALARAAHRRINWLVWFMVSVALIALGQGVALIMTIVKSNLHL